MVFHPQGLFGFDLKNLIQFLCFFFIHSMQDVSVSFEGCCVKGEPVILTKNGRGVLVVMDLADYHVQNSHPAIVPIEVHDLVQEELRRRKATGPKSGANCFSSRIRCGDCGGYYGSKVWHSDDQYRKVVWQCNKKFHNEKKCGTPHLNEELLKRAFVEVFNRQIQNRDEIIAAYDEILKMLVNTADLDRQERRANAELTDSQEKVKALVRQNATTAMDQEKCRNQQQTLIAKHEAAKAKLIWVEGQRQERRNRQHRIEAFVKELRSRESLLVDFDEGLFNSVVERITVEKDGGLTFLFRDGNTVEWMK